MQLHPLHKPQTHQHQRPVFQAGPLFAVQVSVIHCGSKFPFVPAAKPAFRSLPTENRLELCNLKARPAKHDSRRGVTNQQPLISFQTFLRRDCHTWSSNTETRDSTVTPQSWFSTEPENASKPPKYLQCSSHFKLHKPRSKATPNLNTLLQLGQQEVTYTSPTHGELHNSATNVAINHCFTT